MIFTIVVHAPPYSSEAAGTALRFAEAVLRGGHEIYRIFFFADGVHNANRLTVVSRDEVNLQDQWRELIGKHGLDGTVCVSSAINRGIVDAEQAERHELDGSSMHPEFEIGGLGQLIDASLNSDRTVSFG
ncbi:MAG: sulfurtransferase complex subunit TusD [Gammaproteobacteria bacterium]|nr:sulfurtransferase complex subunit TusD [Gammaproteobacteria bacterium]MYH86813.1 sulfurtransferase complex subunit TusD [Gammaproteobacteria bacterium]MYK04222.1 sulfurtransferase complex subunit TusD [Gammaproteobacteria bacterium]